MAENTMDNRDSYLVGPLDIFLLLTFLGAIYFWFYGRKRSANDSPDDLGLKQISKPTQLTTQLSDPSSFVAKMKHSGKSIAIFYGSQTGTAEEFSNRLAKDAQRYSLKAMVLDPEECEVDDLTTMAEELGKCLVVFVLATYGEGDPTDNAQVLCDWLHEDHDLSDLNFVVFGLGNTTYEHYNSMGRYFDERLEELGANRVCEKGEGDDDGNIEEDFVNWRKVLWPMVCKFFDIDISQTNSLSITTTREFKLKEFTAVPNQKCFSGEITKIGAFEKQRPPYDAKNPFLAEIKVNRELHKDASDRSCMHIELNIEGSSIRYQAGDHVGIYPVNDVMLVEKLGKLLNVDLDIVFSLENVDEDAQKQSPFPCPTTYRTALMHYIDIANPVKTHVIAELISYVNDDKDKEFIKQLVSGDENGKQLYNEWVIKDHRNIVNVLEDLPSLKPPIDHLLELLPRLQCRYYSISSSPKMFPNSVHVTAVVVDWMTRIGRQQKGVATTWLKQKIPNDNDVFKIPIFVRHTQFRLPMKPTTPVIMIGPGTGLAPFRGFIQERHSQKQKGCPIGDTVLFFGCRKQMEDYLYQEELEAFMNHNTLSKLFLAFSRDQPEKVYVTHLLRQYREYVWSLIAQGGHIYVCGDARSMAKDVHNILEETLEEIGNMSHQQAISYLKDMGSKGRYSVDVWS